MRKFFAGSVWVTGISWHVWLLSRKPDQTDQQRQAVNERVYFCFIVEVTAIASLSSENQYIVAGEVIFYSEFVLLVISKFTKTNCEMQL